MSQRRQHHACSPHTCPTAVRPALQAQRRAAHLPPERGADAAILSAVHGLLHEAVRPYLYIFGVFLTGSLWDWSCLLSAPEPAPAP